MQCCRFQGRVEHIPVLQYVCSFVWQHLFVHTVTLLVSNFACVFIMLQPCGSTQLSPGTLQALSPTTSMSMGEQPPLSSGPQVPMSMESMVQEPAFGMIPPQLAVPAQPLMMNSFLLNGSHCMTTVTPHQFAATSMGMREPSSSTS